jgi:hypothetical protein
MFTVSVARFNALLLTRSGCTTPSLRMSVMVPCAKRRKNNGEDEGSGRRQMESQEEREREREQNIVTKHQRSKTHTEVYSHATTAALIGVMGREALRAGIGAWKCRRAQPIQRSIYVTALANLV